LPAEHFAEQATPLHCETAKVIVTPSDGKTDSWLTRHIKCVLWYLLGMPIWCALAATGKASLTSHVTKMALQSPHPIRIGNVRFARATLIEGETRVVMMKNFPCEEEYAVGELGVNTKLLRADSLPKNHGTLRTSDGQIIALPHIKAKQKGVVTMSKDPERSNYESINQRIGALAKRKKQEDQFAIEDDPQQDPPSTADFVMAIFYVIFGVVAMAAGLISIFL
jgi:hypothetical protein